MSGRRLRNSQVAPWAGLFVGAFGWFLHHQAGSNGVDYACHEMGSAYVIFVGLFCALVAAAGGIISWTADTSGEGRVGQNRSFARIVGVASSAIFILAIGFQTLAGALVPACLR